MEENSLDSLNKEQKQAVQFGKGELLIIAGAGTGKTTVITKRIAYLLDKGKIKPEEVVALTFTDKAASEMEERIDTLLPYGYVDLAVLTFHKFCEQILRDNALDIGLSPDFKLFDQIQQWLLFRRNLNSFNLNYYKPLGNQTKFINAFIKHFSRCKDEEIYPQEYLDYVEQLKMNTGSVKGVYSKDNHLAAEEDEDLMEVMRINEVAEAYHVYQQLLLDNNALDFGDLIGYTLKLFRTRPKILAKYQKQYKYILVDEFQDTDWAQYELIKLLSCEENNINVVADDDQSIYRFRGASMSNILRFKEDFPNSKELFLINNYRTKQNILDLSYKFIQQNNPNRLEFQLCAQDKENKKPKLSKRLISNTGENGIIEHLHVDNLKNEIKTVADKIIKLYEHNRDVNWDDFAILIRANSQAVNFINEFENRGIPFTFISARGLYTKPIILDLISYLRLIINLSDNIAAYRVLEMDCFGFSYKDIMAILRFSSKKAISVVGSLKRFNEYIISDEGKEIIKKLLRLLNKHSALAKKEKVFKVAYQIIMDLELLQFLQKKGEKIYIEKVKYLNQFFKRLENFENASPDFLENQALNVRDFLSFFDLSVQAGDEGNLETDYDFGPETVKIMTVHGSKGLEFKHVFIVNLVDKRFPSITRKEVLEIPEPLLKEKLSGKDSHLEEERRLFYVAMTRAKDAVYFTSADDYGGVRKKKLSRFLYELGFCDSPEKVAKKEKTKAIKPEEFKPDYSKSLKIKQDKDFKLPLPKKFSFTQLKSFENCPYQYKLAHILKLYGFGKQVFSYGQAMHSTLQKFFQLIENRSKPSQTNLFVGDEPTKPKIPTLKELLEIFESSWIEDWYDDDESKQNYKKEGTDSLKEFYEINYPNFPKVLALEMGFKLKIDDDVLIGRIDRVDELEDGSIEVVDYKTGGVPANLNKIDKSNKNQLLIYQLALQDIYKDKKVKQVTFYYLKKNKALSFKGTDEELDKLREEIKIKIAKIKNSDFTPTPSMFTCNNCDYKDICEYKIIK